VGEWKEGSKYAGGGKLVYPPPIVAPLLVST